ncbi:hypothetical protein GVAV_002276 [Gurleya vavrai]
MITKQVANGTKIRIDEHRSYSCLRNFSYNHQTVCHKYEIITEEGIYTQAVESFNNFLNYEIKKRKGVLTMKEKVF